VSPLGILANFAASFPRLQTLSFHDGKKEDCPLSLSFFRTCIAFFTLPPPLLPLSFSPPRVLSVYGPASCHPLRMKENLRNFCPVPIPTVRHLRMRIFPSSFPFPFSYFQQEARISLPWLSPSASLHPLFFNEMETSLPTPLLRPLLYARYYFFLLKNIPRFFPCSGSFFSIYLFPPSPLVFLLPYIQGNFFPSKLFFSPPFLTLHPWFFSESRCPLVV